MDTLNRWGIPCILTLTLIGCCQNPEDCAPPPETCLDTTIVGTWVTSGFAGTTVYDGESYGGDLAECQSTDYDFSISVDGYYDDPYGYPKLWGGIYNTGTMEVREDWMDEGPFTSYPTEDFATYAGQHGWDQLLCESSGDLEWTCDWTGDTAIATFEVYLTIDPSSPDVAQLTFYGNEYAFLGYDSTETYDCSDVLVRTPSITLVRSNAVGTANVALADGHSTTSYHCDDGGDGKDTGDTGDAGDTGDGGNNGNEDASYGGLTPGEWVLFVIEDFWPAFQQSDNRHGYAENFLEQYVEDGGDRNRVSPFVHHSVNAYGSDPMFRTMIDNTVMYIGAGEDTEAQLATANFAAKGLMQTYAAWSKVRQPPFNPPPPGGMNP